MAGRIIPGPLGGWSDLELHLLGWIAQQWNLHSQRGTPTLSWPQDRGTLGRPGASLLDLWDDQKRTFVIFGDCTVHIKHVGEMTGLHFLDTRVDVHAGQVVLHFGPFTTPSWEDKEMYYFSCSLLVETFVLLVFSIVSSAYCWKEERWEDHIGKWLWKTEKTSQMLDWSYGSLHFWINSKWFGWITSRLRDLKIYEWVIQ